MDNIEDIYYNKYLKYKYKYLELKGNGDGLAEIIRKSIEEKFYGPELLEEIKSITYNNDVEGPEWISLFGKDKKVYEINMIDNCEIDLIKILNKILEKISKKEKPTELYTDLSLVSSDIKLIIDKINNNKIQEYNLSMINYHMINYNEIEIYINNVFNKYTLLNNFSKILKKLFFNYFKLIKKVIKKVKEQKEKEMGLKV